MEQFPAAKPGDIFDFVFAKLVWPIQQQKEGYLEMIGGDKK